MSKLDTVKLSKLIGDLEQSIMSNACQFGRKPFCSGQDFTRGMVLAFHETLHGHYYLPNCEIVDTEAVNKAIQALTAENSESLIYQGKISGFNRVLSGEFNLV